MVDSNSSLPHLVWPPRDYQLLADACHNSGPHVIHIGGPTRLPRAQSSVSATGELSQHPPDFLLARMVADRIDYTVVKEAV